MPKTMTQLYTTLVLVLIRRHMIEKGEWNEDTGIPNNLEMLPENILPILEQVGELAYWGLFEKDVQLLFTDEEVGEGFQHLGLLYEAREMYVCEGAKTTYSFSHLSMQEFLASWHISHNSSLIGKTPLVAPIVLFLAGLSGCSKLPIKTFKPSLLLLCSHEAQDTQVLINSSSNFVDLTTPLAVYAFGYALVHACIYSVESRD